MTHGTPSFGKPRTTVGAILQMVLAHESGLAATAHDFEWRVRGSPLQSIKRLFAEQSRQIDRWLGDVARCAQGAGIAAGQAAAAPAGDSVDSEAAPRAAAKELLRRHEALAGELRHAVDVVRHRESHTDAGELLTGLLHFHETSAWMLRLLLEAPERSHVV